jgi:predicted permease
MKTLWNDLRYGLRTLAGNLHFSMAAIMVLALGFAANGVIFSFVDAVLFRPLPVNKPDELVRVFTSQQTNRGEIVYERSSYPDYLDLRRQSAGLAELAAYEHRGAIWTGPQGSALLTAEYVSENYFPMLGVKALAGRTFGDEEASQGRSTPSVVLSYGLWKDRLGGDPGIVGHTIQLNKQFYVIVGVAAREFRGTDSMFAPDIWFWIGSTSEMASERGDRNARSLQLMGRLRGNASITRAQAEANVLGAQLAQAYPKTNTGSRFTVKGEMESRLPGVSIFADMLLGISGLVLMLACVNVANLLLYRGESRRKEFAIRRALGARPARLIRMLLTENALLSLMGGAFSLLISFWIIKVLPSLLPPMVIPLGFDFRLDTRVMLFTLFLALFAVLVFGLGPIFRAAKQDLLPELTGSRGGGRSIGSHGRVRQGLVVAQLAISLMLLLGAGMLIRTLVSAEEIDPGFNAKQNMLIVRVVPSMEGPTAAQKRQSFDQILERIKALPGVRQATLTRFVPFSPDGGGAAKNIIVPGKALQAGGESGQEIHYSVVAPGYFSTLGIRILRGRAFGREDSESSPGVVIINDTLARKLWPDEDSLGRHILVGGPKGRECEVIGVVQDGRYNRPTEPQDTYLYLPYSQETAADISFLVQTVGAPGKLADPIRQQVQQVDRNIMVLSIMTLSEHLRYVTFEGRTSARLVSTLGLLGLLLAAVGLYGLVSYTVCGRIHEIGVRIALGAQRWDVGKIVLGQSLRLILLGLGIGLVLGVGLMRLLTGYVFGAGGFDLPSFSLPIVILAGVALVATYIPAHRAMRVDPAVALRHD